MYHYIYIAANKVLKGNIHHINVVTKPSRTLDNLFSFKKCFIKVTLYIGSALVNIGHIYVQYSPCGPIHFNYKVFKR